MKLPRWLRSRKTRAVLALIAAAAATAAFSYWPRYEPPADPRANGVYAFGDGSRVVVVSRTSDTYRAVVPGTGESRALHPTDGGLARGGLEYHSGPGWSAAEPVEVRVAFESAAGGEVTALQWRREGEDAERAAKVEHSETIFTFPSGELTLRGKLVTPPGGGPFPVVVLVHGSEAYSAVDYYREPYLLASYGFAVVAYDKRGTGKSEGKYTQDFHVLAGDALAAAAAVADRPEVDRTRINLAGFSQGGWIAPLAASKSEVPIRSVYVGYGTPLPITEEDRWGYVYQLERHGFGEEEIRQADEINEVIEQIVDHGKLEAFAELGRRLDRYRDAEWFSAVKGSDSALGFLAETKVPLIALRLYFQFFAEITAERLYSSMPVLETLDVPMLWIFGGEDSSLPTPSSIEALEAIKAAHGKSIDIVLFPDAEHGILRFEDKDGDRRLLGIEPDYYRTMIRWLRRRNGLEPSAAHEAAGLRETGG